MEMKPDYPGKDRTQLAVVVCVAVCLSAATRAAGAVATIELVTLAAASPDDQVSILPTSQSVFAPGTTFFVEVWAQTTDSNGLSSVSIDSTYNTNFVSAVGITHTSLFSELQHGIIDDASGIVDDLSGSHLAACSDQVAVAPNWGRVAIIEMAADVQRAIEGDNIPAATAVVNAWIAKHREKTFSNGFALGAAFVAGAAATVRVGVDDSENSEKGVRP
ncbi:MAG: hypothetical protein IID41_08185 [Planctomycetes bacterium]|nr:hypothetical protein [Planctomycetota bacterium]